MNNFNPQGSHEPRLPFHRYPLPHWYAISIHKALTSLDATEVDGISEDINFNPQGSHEPRLGCQCRQPSPGYFNPQGSHEPRPGKLTFERNPLGFQSTRLSRASTINPKTIAILLGISIHKALTSLDCKRGDQK